MNSNWCPPFRIDKFSRSNRKKKLESDYLVMKSFSFASGYKCFEVNYSLYLRSSLTAALILRVDCTEEPSSFFATYETSCHFLGDRNLNPPFRVSSHDSGFISAVIFGEEYTPHCAILSISAILVSPRSKYSL
jgi:hypothetical protein